ncbi:26S proteasome non-ATPase regulatory subunit 4-like isoform X1 [Oncorhynchus nerka]|uniref:26S proteasome non-ATPase regulatory subunit 4-like isoform X1 n=2 Tax=Oncorhynchus nerka TaxID=8023 RepID=UPI001131365D|nr:26S proteasome non-ATPase regulatory subunit 4-like isoform X1 [Oncorhynchus nerka]
MSEAQYRHLAVASDLNSIFTESLVAILTRLSRSDIETCQYVGVGVDPSADPELALRVPMEEQRQRQEEEARRVAVASAADVTTVYESEDALLKMSVTQPETGRAAVLPDCSNMTKEEQIAYAMQISLSGEEYGDVMAMDTGAPMDTETAKVDDDYDVMQDPEYLQSVLENLPGVDPNNEAIRNAMGSLASQTGPPKPDSKKDEEKKK